MQSNKIIKKTIVSLNIQSSIMKSLENKGIITIAKTNKNIKMKRFSKIIISPIIPLNFLIIQVNHIMKIINKKYNKSLRIIESSIIL